jgi:hypothetical protein
MRQVAAVGTTASCDLTQSGLQSNLFLTRVSIDSELFYPPEVFGSHDDGSIFCSFIFEAFQLLYYLFH